ncbi:MAG: hypothetical protein Q8R55_06620 [Candidatus Taylorbacteria bacterium]|nr:hypothetical protein [Candidatus Taylorbacteria bacterium]
MTPRFYFQDSVSSRFPFRLTSVVCGYPSAKVERNDTEMFTILTFIIKMKKPRQFGEARPKGVAGIVIGQGFR